MASKHDTRQTIRPTADARTSAVGLGTWGHRDPASALFKSTYTDATSTDLGHDFVCQRQVPLSVDLGDIRLSMPQDRLGGFQTILGPDLRCGRVPELEGRPLWDASPTTGALDCHSVAILGIASTGLRPCRQGSCAREWDRRIRDHRLIRIPTSHDFRQGRSNRTPDRDRATAGESPGHAARSRSLDLGRSVRSCALGADRSKGHHP
jgi:hypothetical protein